MSQQRFAVSQTPEEIRKGLLTGGLTLNLISEEGVTDVDLQIHSVDHMNQRLVATGVVLPDRRQTVNLHVPLEEYDGSFEPFLKYVD